CITVYTSPEGSGLGRFSIRLGYETSLVARKHREVLGVPRQGIELLSRVRQAFVILHHSLFSSLSSNYEPFSLRLSSLFGYPATVYAYGVPPPTLFLLTVDSPVAR